MSDINKVTLTGRVAGDPETHYTEAGKPVVNFTLAVSYDLKNPPQERRPLAAAAEAQGSSLPWREMVAAGPRTVTKGEVSFIEIVVLGKLAEGCSQFLKKGRKVLVEGRLQQRKGFQVLAHQVYYLTSLYEGTRREAPAVPQEDRIGRPHEDVPEKVQDDMEGE